MAEPGGDPALSLAPAHIVGRAFTTFRHRWRQVLPIAVVVAVVTLAVDLLATAVADVDNRSAVVKAAVVLTLAMNTGATTLGATMMAGLFDHAVGEHQHGHPVRSTSWVLRHLPWGKLVAADILVTLARFAGFVLCFIPGFAVIALTGITGPVIMLEGKGARAAIRRSVHLVRPHFWLVFMLVSVPLTFEAAVEHLIEEIPFLHDFFAHVLALAVVEVPIATAVSLIEVTLAYILIERDSPGTIAAAAHE